MAIYLNLYHEIQRKKLQRQRDPVKIAIMAGLLVASGFVGYYFWRLEAVRSVKSQQAQVQSQWDKLEPKQKAAQARSEELKSNISVARSLEHHAENRFYWAPLVEQILQTIPPDVQITGINGTLTSQGSKKVTVAIDGLAAGDSPRAVAEQLRIAFQTKLSSQYNNVTSVFRTLEDAPEPVQIQGKNETAAVFVIDVVLTRPDVDDNSSASNAKSIFKH
jgi:hypothetical protein